MEEWNNEVDDQRKAEKKAEDVQQLRAAMKAVRV